MKKLLAALFILMPGVARAAYFPPVSQASATVNAPAYAPGQQFATQTTSGAARADLTTWGNGTTLSATAPLPVQSTGTTTVAGTVTVTQGTASSLKVDLSGTAANSTAIKVDGSAVTQPVTTVSTVTIQSPNGNTTALPVSGTVSMTGFPLVPTGVNASTAAVTNQGGTALAIISTTTLAVAPVSGQSISVISTTVFTVQGNLAQNGATQTANRVGVVAGIAQTAYGNNGVTFTLSRDAALAVGKNDGNLFTSQRADLTSNCYKAVVDTTAYSSATDLLCISGNAFNTVIVNKFNASCTQTTAGIIHGSLQRRSTQDVGAFSTMTATQMDTGPAAVAASSVTLNTAAPTRGTWAGGLETQLFGCMAPGTAGANDAFGWQAGPFSNAIVLRGITQQLCFSLADGNDGAGLTITGAKFDMNIQWCEATTP